jgi:acetyl-CoA carboxylase biotin carboxyl carrier protein
MNGSLSPAAAVAPRTVESADSTNVSASIDGSGAEAGHIIRAPLVGTFYAAPQPGAASFVSVGDVVVVGQTVGIVEAMKLMNAITADVAGRVVEIFVANEQSVEFEQPLLRIMPSMQVDADSHPSVSARHNV